MTMAILLLFVLVSAMTDDPYVLLSETKMLEFKRDSMTNFFKWKPVPQMECFGELCKEWQVEAAWCVNQGFHENKFHWLCVAKFDHEFEFKDYVVECEGYGIGTEYESIVRGSCALRYSLEKIPQITQEFLWRLMVEGFKRLIHSLYIFLMIISVGISIRNRLI